MVGSFCSLGRTGPVVLRECCVAGNERNVHAFVTGDFDAGRLEQQFHPRPFTDNSRGRGAARSADRDCAGGYPTALLATFSFSPLVARALGALSLCTQE